MTIVRSLKYCGLLIEGVTQTIENETNDSAREKDLSNICMKVNIPHSTVKMLWISFASFHYFGI